MKKLLLSLMLASVVAFGAQGDHQGELSVMGGGVHPEGNLDLEEELNAGLRLGINLDDMFFDIIEGGAERVSSVDYDKGSYTSVNRIFVNIIKEYELSTSTETVLYGLIGLGIEDYGNPRYENEDGGFAQYGIGIKQWVADNFALKAEVRHGITFNGDNNLFYSVGFVIPLGKKTTKKAPEPQPIANEKAAEAEPMAAENEPAKDVVKEEPKAVVVPVVAPVSNDDDNDGVLNKDDKCPETKPGKVVDSEGCLRIFRVNIEFDNDQSSVKDEYAPVIDKITKFMSENEEYNLHIEGYTDSKGTEEYNEALSQRRADSVADEIVKQGIDKNRVAAKGLGEANPIASNETEEGRAHNRRIDAHLSK